MELTLEKGQFKTGLSVSRAISRNWFSEYLNQLF